MLSVYGALRSTAVFTMLYCILKAVFFLNKLLGNPEFGGDIIYKSI
jgi:hypothetical protein